MHHFHWGSRAPIWNDGDVGSLEVLGAMVHPIHWITIISTDCNMKWTKRKVQILKFTITILLCIGALMLFFYFGVIYERIERQGYSLFVKEQIVNILFGVLAGVITSGLLWYGKISVEKLKENHSSDVQLSGQWDEKYEPLEFPEPIQEQNLAFTLKHYGDKLSGKIVGTGNPIYLQSNNLQDGRPRLFDIKGLREGNYVSFSGILDDENRRGHTVYLMEIKGEYDILEGYSIYYDTTHHKLTMSKSTLTKVEKA